MRRGGGTFDLTHSGYRIHTVQQDTPKKIQNVWRCLAVSGGVRG